MKNKEEELMVVMNREVTVIRLKVSLWVDPYFAADMDEDEEVYRIVEIKGDQSLHDLHEIIQKAFDWDNDHLYSFYMDNKERRSQAEYVGSPYGEQDFDFEYEEKREQAISTEIRDLNLRSRKKFKYLFDYGDSFLHEIVVKKTNIEPEEGKKYPCIVETVGVAPDQYPEYEEEDG